MTYRAIVAEYLKARFNVTDERGATAVEYGLLIGTLAAFIVAAANLLGADITRQFGNILP